MFQFPKYRFMYLLIQYTMTGIPAGFPHSDIVGSMLVCQLPDAFRRLPRLSSPSTAKASTVCAFSLDPIARNGFRTISPHCAMQHTLPYELTLIIIKERNVELICEHYSLLLLVNE